MTYLRILSINVSNTHLWTCKQCYWCTLNKSWSILQYFQLSGLLHARYGNCRITHNRLTGLLCFHHNRQEKWISCWNDANCCFWKLLEYNFYVKEGCVSMWKCWSTDSVLQGNRRCNRPEQTRTPCGAQTNCLKSLNLNRVAIQINYRQTLSKFRQYIHS